MKKIILLCCGLLLVFLLAGCERQSSDRVGVKGVGQTVGDMVMPRFTLPSVIDGGAVDSDDFKGKVLLVTFFAIWCPPCLEEIPALIKLQNTFGQAGFSVIGLSVDESGPEPVKRLVAKAGINYSVLMADAGVAQGFGGVTGIPVTFLVDRQGRIVSRYIGYNDYAVFKNDIETILNKGGQEPVGGIPVRLAESL